MELDVEVYSPRWGHNDTYRIVLERETMTINNMARRATCNYIDDRDPNWTGERLEGIFRNDHIYPAGVFQDLLEYVWVDWRDGRLNDIQAGRELQELFQWLNTCTRAKPDTDFWRGKF